MKWSRREGIVVKWSRREGIVVKWSRREGNEWIVVKYLR